MTTIAYRDRTLAADSLVSGEMMRWGTTAKLFRAPCGWIGAACGDAGAASEFAQWMETLTFEIPAPPSFAAPEFKSAVDGLLISHFGTIWCWTGRPRLFPLETEFTAIGSGAKIAMGAMAMGATAEQAVAVAAQFDVYTGGKIETLSIRSPSRPEEVKP